MSVFVGGRIFFAPLPRSMARPLGATDGLLDKLSDAQIDCYDEVTSACSVQVLAMLSAASRRHHEHCRTRLQLMHDQHELMQRDLCEKLGFLYHQCPENWQLLDNVRALTIPDDLPHAMRPILGKWLRAEGRLGKVSCVRCASWMRTGEIVGWIEHESWRAGAPQCMSAEERFALEKMDTPDGLLKVVLMHAHKTLAYPYMLMGC